MNIAALLKQVPDLVEELEVDASGKELDRSWLRLIINEFDEHALEQALLLKEQHGAQVKVLALDIGGVDDMLFTALAKGADSAAKITGDFDRGVDSHRAARIFKEILGGTPYDLILKGCSQRSCRVSLVRGGFRFLRSSGAGCHANCRQRVPHDWSGFRDLV